MRILFSKLTTAGVIAGCLFIAVFIYAVMRFGTQSPGRHIQIRYDFTIQNTTDRPIRDLALQVLAPMRITSFQQCAKISADQAYTTSLSPYGQQTLRFKWDFLPPYAIKVIHIRSDLSTWSKSRETGPADFAPYLRAEPFIESDDAQIKALAAELKADSTLQTVKRAFDWVSAKIVYSGYIKRPRGALYALKYRKGDCTEFACLLAALCRADGIPARVMGGYICPASAVLDLGEYHNWVEFYVDKRWHMADPQRKRFMSGQDTYIGFAVVQPSKGNEEIISSQAVEGLKIRLNG
jgi:transglutaminase-like putative cysteine protease